MATLEQERPQVSSSPLDDISELTASVPTPFPSTTTNTTGSISRGRTGGIIPSSESSSPVVRNTNSSRSPSIGRLGGVLDKIKRSMSKDRTNSSDRGSLMGDRDSIAESELLILFLFLNYLFINR